MTNNAIYFVAPATREQAIAHLITLSPEDRYTRFCQSKTDEGIRNYVEQAKGSFYGVFVLGSFTPVSLLHYCPSWDNSNWCYPVLAEGDRFVEVAFSTTREHQGKGYGQLLMLFVKGLATVDRVDMVIMNGLAENQSIKKLARRSGFEVTTEYGEFDATMRTYKRKIKDHIEFVTAIIKGEKND